MSDKLDPNDPRAPLIGAPQLRLAGVGTSSDGLPAPVLNLTGVGTSSDGLPAPELRLCGAVAPPARPAARRVTRQGVTAVASAFALGGGFVLGPAVAAADGGS